MSDIDCNILLSGNKTLFRIDEGWEGIPFNIIWNSFICLFLIIGIVLIRWRNFRTQDDHKKSDDWLHFIFRDHKTNDMKTAKYKMINRRHRLAFLPPILHEYEQLITERMDAKTDEKVEYFKHHIEGDKTKDAKRQTFDEFPSLRSDSELGTESESRINRLYSGFGIKKYNSHEEDQQVMRLKSVLIDNYRSLSQTVTREEMIRDKEKSFFSFDWFYNYILIKDEEIVVNKGSDALQYLLFERYLICFLALLTFICLTIILPTNLQGNAEDETKMYARTTISNLGSGSNLIWIHSLMTIIIAPLGLYMMRHFSKLILSEGLHIDRRVLLIQNIPKSKRKISFLLKYFEKYFPKCVIKRITFVYDIRQLNYLKNHLLNAIEAKKYCYQYRLLYEERIEVRPYCCGRCGGMCCCCQCCPKLDGVLYYAEEKAEFENEIDIEIKQVVTTPKALAFVEFENRAMCRIVHQYFHSKAFVARQWCHSLTNLLSAKSDSMQTHLWNVNYAPYPEDIEWYDLSWESQYERIWSIFMHIILVLIFLFVTTPTIAVETVLLPLSDKNSNTRSWTLFLKPYLLMLMTALLPSLIMAVQYQIPYSTKSDLEHGLMFKSYFFLIFMVLILPPLNLYTAAVLVDEVLTPSDNSTRSYVNWNCLFRSGNSGFFMSYVLSSAIVGNMFEVTRVSELCTYFFHLFYTSRSIAEYESARQKVYFQFSYGMRYAKVLLMFTIVVTYSVSCPLVSVAGLFFMATKYMVDRYNLLYAYNPTQISYRMHSTVVLCVHLALIFLLIQVGTTLTLYDDDSSWFKPSYPVFITLFGFLVVTVYNLYKKMNQTTES